MNNVTLFPFETEFAFWKTAKEDVLLAVRETLDTYESCRIGLAGGSTPKMLYEMLSQEDLPWEKIHWILIDERYVPSDSPESNLKMIRQALFSKAPVPPNNITAFDTGLPLLSSAKEMSRQLIALSHERFPIFDLLILGAGADGHIASLFEGDAALEATHYASTAHAAGATTPQRLTCSLISLLSSERALLLLHGEAKKPVVDSLNGEGDLPLTALSVLAKDVPIKVLTYS